MNVAALFDVHAMPWALEAVADAIVDNTTNELDRRVGDLRVVNAGSVGMATYFESQR